MSHPLTVTIIKPYPGEELCNFPLGSGEDAGFAAYANIYPRHGDIEMSAKLIFEDPNIGTMTIDGELAPYFPFPCVDLFWFALPEDGVIVLPERVPLELVVEARCGRHFGRAVQVISYQRKKGDDSAIVIEIDSPIDTEQVATTFYVMGYVTPLDATMTSRLEQGGTKVADGVKLRILPPGYNWCFRYSNIPTGFYDLVVRGEKAGQAPQEEFVTIEVV